MIKIYTPPRNEKSVPEQNKYIYDKKKPKRWKSHAAMISTTTQYCQGTIYTHHDNVQNRLQTYFTPPKRSSSSSTTFLCSNGIPNLSKLFSVQKHVLLRYCPSPKQSYLYKSQHVSLTTKNSQLTINSF